MRPRVTSIGLVMPPSPTGNFDYPEHIDRASIDALPCKPGIYYFLDRHRVPVYIGKSINIRARVLSHLRCPQEAAMLQAAHSVDFERTAGEIGALLRESQLIKQLQPRFNVLLRGVGEVFSLRFVEDSLLVQPVGSYESDVSEQGMLYGLFASRGAAQEGLRALVRRHRLCPALLGLEKATRGRACFACQIGHCNGACIGKEPARVHHARLRDALEQLQAEVWPYAGPIGIVEEDEDLRQVHVVDHWSYRGTLQGRRSRFTPNTNRVVDIDVYKILSQPLQNGDLKFTLMAQRAAASR